MKYEKTIPRKVRVSRYSLIRAIFRAEMDDNVMIHITLNEMYNEFCAQEKKTKHNITVLSFDVNNDNEKAIEYIVNAS